MPQCQNCGSYSVSDRRIRINPKTGQPVDEHPLREGCGQAVILYGAGIVLLWIVIAVVYVFTCGASGCPSTPLSNIGGALVALVGFVLPIYVIWQGIVRSRRIAQLPWTHNYRCNNCGYSWSWMEGNPLPPYHSPGHP